MFFRLLCLLGLLLELLFQHRPFNQRRSDSHTTQTSTLYPRPWRGRAWPLHPSRAFIPSFQAQRHRPPPAPIHPDFNTELEQTLSSLSVSITHGDLTAPTSSLASGFVGGPGTQLSLRRAALQSRAKRYIPWQFGVAYDVLGRGSPQPLFDEQLDVRALLRGQGRTRWTIVSTGIFTRFLLEPAFGVVDLGRRTVTALGRWANEVTATTAEDIGRLTARIALDENERGGTGWDGVVHVAGDTTTFQGVADVVKTHGWDLQERVATVEELEGRLAEDLENCALRYQLVWARNKGVSWDVARTWNRQRGVEMEGLKQSAEKTLPRP
ncbi:hypothetical protein CONPUDRAFT_146546 [Coniophora puteana RWD-64-598 SS2]|uniref:Uncharacterized protein n=1 Tax=Coniophora puteana (strain RWD-64-598) TaxID=741705 RepID=A0A5M3MCN2_CONPW|nr:uncharacterized protein CONPUDRAFT_146546 [Coniophora puteana RWD-64-598 SS2]EIW76823.1 hypothetical protein CONPUDRAFT_146546 [Coniophora puteana RWD-64-598 SS2]